MVLPHVLISLGAISPDPPGWVIALGVLGTGLFVALVGAIFNWFLDLGPPMSKLEKHFLRKYVFWFWAGDPEDGSAEGEWPPSRCPKCGREIIRMNSSGSQYCPACREVVTTDATKS